MRKIISLICLLAPALAFSGPSDPPHLRSDAPDKHVVVKGDTLWDISSKFFSDPWKWQYIWGINKEAIKDPHWIYPGDVIYLDRLHGTLSVGQPPGASSAAAPDRDVVRLSPQIRSDASSHDAVPVIPFNAIEPFLNRPLVVSAEELKSAPTIIGARDNRVLLGKGDTGFVKGLSASMGTNWQIYRPGKPLIDPDTHNTLGFETIYLGNAQVTDASDISSIFITASTEEISQGDRLIISPSGISSNFQPHAPASSINARIISIQHGNAMAGTESVVTFNKGSADGVEVGHVLALSRKGSVVSHDKQDYSLPDQRYGLAMIFRVFDKVSYALIVQSQLPAQLLDRAQTP